VTPGQQPGELCPDTIRLGPAALLVPVVGGVASLVDTDSLHRTVLGVSLTRLVGLLKFVREIRLLILRYHGLNPERVNIVEIPLAEIRQDELARDCENRHHNQDTHAEECQLIDVHSSRGKW
jgi:hypothetical protein